jgi:hypothetical protein
MTMSITHKWIAMLSIVAVAAACGGSDQGEERASAPAGASAKQSQASGSKIDACALVTQADATTLFGQPATRQEGSKIAAPMMIGECLWTWDAETSNQLLQFRVWSTEQAYSRPEDEFVQDFPLGDRGHVHAHPQAGVSIEWIQGGKMIGMHYSKVGSAVPSPVTKTEALKELARKVAGKL